MEIKKQYDIGAIANEIKDRIMISSNGEVCIDVLLAQNIVDVLEEIGRMEKEGNKGKTVIDRLSPASPSQDGNKKAPENLKNECDEKPECYGKYSLGSTETRGCVKCSCGGECFIKSCRKKCFGTYVDTSSICANCTYVCECKKTTEEWDNE